MNTISPKELTNKIVQKLDGIMDNQELSQAVFWIIENIYGMKRTQILAQTPIMQNQSQEEKLELIMQRLLKHEPLQYVLGEAFFYGRRFLVNPSVLIPRPETEELVHLIKKENSSEKLKILDIGTGSGCIAISLALELKQPNVIALDIDAKALETAEENAKELGANVLFFKSDLFSEIPASADLDIIVSNPPYVLPEEIHEMGKNVVDYEPHLALFAPNHDHLIFYRRIAEVAKKILKPEGKIYLEINERYGQEVKALLEEKGFFDVAVFKDMQGTDRMVRGLLSV